MHSFLLVILAATIIDIGCVTRIGYFDSASYVSNTTKVIITYQNACSECICNAFVSNASSSYVGINCFKNNQTCELFASPYTPSMLKINTNSIFIFKQQSPSQNNTIIFPLSGVTVAGYGNGTSGNMLDALKHPWGLALDANDMLYVADYDNYRVLKFQAGSSVGTIVAGTGAWGFTLGQLRNPAEIAVDPNSNVYIADNFNYRAMMWRKNATFGSIVAGNGTLGNGTSTMSESIGLTIDSQQSVYVSDYLNHRVMKWMSNGASGTLVAGVTGVPGNSSQQLSRPHGLYLNEPNSYLYIADLGNHRVQRYRLGSARNGVTVGGGNGFGYGSHQLNEPHGICVSKKTGDIYIADRRNQRIQRWSAEATSGVTVVGITGMAGTNATLLNAPVHVALSENETFLFVSDQNNHRVQRYQLT